METTYNNPETGRKWILWRRVSTKKQGASGLGLEAQSNIAEYFMHSKPEKVFTDIYSGTKLATCPNLNKAIDYCKETGSLLVVAKTDRFRNVTEALDVLDRMGEGNIKFCDLPTTNRMVLTIMFAVWENQAIMGRINTQRALAVRREMVARGESWINAKGEVCNRIGRPKGADLSVARAAYAELATEAKLDWRRRSVAYGWVQEKLAEGWSRAAIIAEFNKLHSRQPTVYCTREGKPLSKGILSQWARESVI